MALRNLLIALGALALIAGIGLATYWFTRAPAAAGAAGPVAPPEGMLVAVRALPSGTLLRPADIAWQELKAAAMPAGSIARSPTTESAYLGAVTRRDFAAGEALADAALVKAGDRAFLAAVLTPGDRAVSIAVDAPQSVAGLVLPGDRVDVILTQSFGEGTGDLGHKSVGETVLTDIRVIAVDQWLLLLAKPASKEQRVGTTASLIPGTMTLEVSDIDAERLLVAVQLGKVQLVARSLEGPGQAAATAGPAPAPVWAGDVSPALLAFRRPLQSQAPAAPPGPRVDTGGAPGPRARPTLEVMRGSKTETH
jgi:pilus assembly protein CpaB